MNGQTDATAGMIEFRHVAGTTRAAYNDIYADVGIQHPDRMWEWVLDVLDVRSGHALLDVACGEAQMVAHAAARGLEAYGVDLSDIALKVGRRREAQRAADRGAASPTAPTAPTAPIAPIATEVTDAGSADQAGSASPASALGLAAANGESLPYADGAFDYVTNLGSLEHYDDPIRGAAEMARVVADDGIVLLHVPNAFGLRWNVMHAWRHGDVHDDGQPIQRYATRAQWTRVLEAGGLEVVRVLGYEEMAHHPVGLSGWLGALRHPSRLLVPLAGLLPVDMASIFVFLCRKAPPVRPPLPPRDIASAQDEAGDGADVGADVHTDDVAAAGVPSAAWPAVEPTVVPAPRDRTTVRTAARPPVDAIEVAGIELQYGKGVREAATIDIGRDAFDDWWRTITDTADRRGEVVLVAQRPDGRVLVHTKGHYPLGVWRLPTGGIKPFEAVLDALARESVEEMGQALGVQRFLGLIEHRLIGGPAGREVTVFPSYAFLLNAPVGAIEPQDGGEGITGFRWVSLEELALLTANLERLGGRYAAWGRFRGV
ncbi:MAG: methyltransferase domain-containing protein, partial [Ardenticatenales bacterium]